MSALSRSGFFVIVALPLLIVSVVAAVIAFRVGGESEGPPVTPVTATVTATATASATPPTPTASPPETPTATPSASPVETPTATPSPPAVEGSPFSLSDLEEALSPAGIRSTDLYDPRSACAGTGVEGVPLVVAGDDTERFAVWVLWVYPDSEARKRDWRTDQRAEPLLAGCEPPNGFIYWNRNLLLWFVGFYGDGVTPGSPPHSREEVRQHPVIRAFLALVP